MKYFLLFIYTLIGIGAFAISFYLEYSFFCSVTDSREFALSITLVLESAKVLTIVFHRFVDDSKNYKIADSITIAQYFFKCLLFLLSVICSIAIISRDLDNPHLDEVKQKDRAFITDQYSSNLDLLNNQRDNKFVKITNEIKEKNKQRYQGLADYYEPRIEKEEELRNKEFENEINGVRKGDRWNEHDRKVKELTSEYRKEKDKLQNSENIELNSYMSSIEKDYQNKIDALNDKNNSSLTTLEKFSYADDKRVKNRVVTSLLMTISEGLDINMEYLTFTLLFSILISILLELTIYLTFNYSVMFQQNVIEDVNNQERLRENRRYTDGNYANQDYPSTDEYTNNYYADDNQSPSDNLAKDFEFSDHVKSTQDDFNNEQESTLDDFFNPNGPEDETRPCA